MFVACALIFSLGGLFGVHTYIIFTNGSTLEMDALYKSNPFSRTKRVFKTKADQRQVQIVQGRNS